MYSCGLPYITMHKMLGSKGINGHDNWGIKLAIGTYKLVWHVFVSTVLLGKRIGSPHFVFADVTSETCMPFTLTWYTIKKMDRLFTSCMASRNHL